MLQSC